MSQNIIHFLIGLFSLDATKLEILIHLACHLYSLSCDMVETQLWDAWKSLKSIRTIIGKQKVFVSAPEIHAPNYLITTNA